MCFNRLFVIVWPIIYYYITILNVSQNTYIKFLYWKNPRSCFLFPIYILRRKTKNIYKKINTITVKTIEIIKLWRAKKILTKELLTKIIVVIIIIIVIIIIVIIIIIEIIVVIIIIVVVVVVVIVIIIVIIIIVIIIITEFIFFPM